MSSFLLRNVRDGYGSSQDVVIQLDLVKYVRRCNEGKILKIVFQDNTEISVLFDSVNTCLIELINLSEEMNSEKTNKVSQE